MRYGFLIAGIMLFLFSLCLPLSLVFNEHKNYDIDDFDRESNYDYDYENSIFIAPPDYCEMEFKDLSDGKIIISFYQDGFSTTVWTLTLELRDDENNLIWSHASSVKGLRTF